MLFLTGVRVLAVHLADGIALFTGGAGGIVLRSLAGLGGLGRLPLTGVVGGGAAEGVGHELLGVTSLAGLCDVIVVLLLLFCVHLASLACGERTVWSGQRHADVEWRQDDGRR